MNGTLEAKYIQLNGIVQGVGMRPHVYRLAIEHHINGWVLNSAAGVQIHAEGTNENLKAFAVRLLSDAPPQALITSCVQAAAEPEGFNAFEIRKSTGEEAITVMVSPDIATCKDCRQEVLDPADRRYAYAFTNCTNCGPRFTIIRDLPYDRAKTVMAAFPMCPECQQEYENPMHRRFHAQPNACPVCGPQLSLLDANGQPMAGDARDLLKAGKVLAVKGLGGFHLAVDARNPQAVRRLRERKKRDAKAFALMARDLDAAARYAEISELEVAWLQSSRAPIVIMNCHKAEPGATALNAAGRCQNAGLAHQEIHPALPTIGIMLPYTPLHYFLFDDDLDILVMTSANISDEPLIISNEEALDKLPDIADAFLLHNRDIENPCDDSVVILNGRGELQFFRRSRGFVPQAVQLPFASLPVMAAGPEMKNCFCMVRGSEAFISQHWGDLNHYLNYERYLDGMDKFKKMLDVAPAIIAHDIHPEYQATRWAKLQKGSELVPVQHHWAHLASVMAEHGLNEPVMGLICDGTGMGLDDQIWGCEILTGDYSGFQRLGQLAYVPFPGGDMNARRPYRMAAVYFYHVYGMDGLKLAEERLPDLSAEEAALLAHQLKDQRHWVGNSSCGRLFDAVSALLGICANNRYEGQAAIELEALASVSENGYYPYYIAERERKLTMDVRPLWEALAADSLSISPQRCSRRFHNTMRAMFTEALTRARDICGINTVVLSGGVFHNQILLRELFDSLEAAGFKVFANQAVPPGDGGIALGQAAIAAYRYRM